VAWLLVSVTRRPIFCGLKANRRILLYKRGSDLHRSVQTILLTTSVNDEASLQFSIYLVERMKNTKRSFIYMPFSFLLDTKVSV
jgi:hypothetical protein